jgi:hypothetical protein
MKKISLNWVFFSTNQLDEKWKRFKEVEELYDEIMKNNVGNRSISKESNICDFIF